MQDFSKKTANASSVLKIALRIIKEDNARNVKTNTPSYSLNAGTAVSSAVSSKQSRIHANNAINPSNYKTVTAK